MDIPQQGDPWSSYLVPVTERFNREAGIQLGEADWEFPTDLQKLAFFQACKHDHLLDRLGVPFHQIRTPKKRENCLDLGCGVSFFIYPWTSWDAHFYGHELSDRIVKFIQSRGPQLNSKLLKSIRQGGAHRLDPYEGQFFDLVIATGFFYYYPLDYFTEMWTGLRRVLKPKGEVILDLVRMDSPWLDEWGLIELFKGSEPLLTPAETWLSTIKNLGGKVIRQMDGELFTTVLIS